MHDAKTRAAQNDLKLVTLDYARGPWIAKLAGRRRFGLRLKIRIRPIWALTAGEKREIWNVRKHPKQRDLTE